MGLFSWLEDPTTAMERRHAEAVKGKRNDGSPAIFATYATPNDTALTIFCQVCKKADGKCKCDKDLGRPRKWYE